MWGIVFTVAYLLAGNGETHNAVVQLEEPSFATEEDCQAFLEVKKRPLVVGLLLYMKLPMDTQVDLKGECKSVGTPA